MSLEAVQVPDTMEVLPFPQFRYIHFKKRTKGQFQHYDRHWKSQVAYMRMKETGEFLWQNIEDVYVQNDNDGNGDVEVSLEEYRNNDLKKVG